MTNNIHPTAHVMCNSLHEKITPKQIELIKKIGSLVKYPKLVDLLNDYKYLQNSMTSAVEFT